jgi:hypothetical protein
MIGVAPIYAICFAGCVRNTLVLSASLPPCCMRSTAALLQLQLRQGHPTLAQRSSESGAIAQPLLRDTLRAHALRPQPDSELGYLQIFNAGCISGTAHPPLQSHVSHVAGCRHCNHHHHDTGRAHQVPPSDSKRQRSARQVLPPPQPTSTIDAIFHHACFRYSGPADCAKQIFRESGIRGLYVHPRANPEPIFCIN